MHSTPSTRPIPAITPRRERLRHTPRGGQLADFEERRARVEQAVDALARQQLAARGVAFLAFAPPPCATWASRVQGVDLFEHRRAVGGELRRTGLSWVCRIAMDSSV
jgi:hypothetical protein